MPGELLQIICDIVYPRRCAICGNIVTSKDKKACPECVKGLQVIKEPRCKKCSKPIGRMEDEFCYDCSVINFHYTKGYALWVYDKQMRRSVTAFKYNNKREYADFYIEELLIHYGSTITDIKPDALIPIPLHKSKYRIRGYNQAQIIAKGLGTALHIPVFDKVLCRVKKTMPQKQLNDRERRKNLSNAFGIGDGYWDVCESLKRVILVDDIYTTGSTIEACSNVLRNAGVNEVFFISLCIGKGF